MRHYPIILLSLSCVGPPLMGMRPAFKYGVYTQWDSLGEINVSFMSVCQLEIASWLGIVSSSTSQWWGLIWHEWMQTLHMLPVSVSLYASQSSCVWKTLFFLLSSILPALKIFPPPLLYSSLSLRWGGRIWWKHLI